MLVYSSNLNLFSKYSLRAYSVLGIGYVKVNTVRIVFTEFIVEQKRRTNEAVTVVCYQCLDGGAKESHGCT